MVAALGALAACARTSSSAPSSQTATAQAPALPSPIATPRTGAQPRDARASGAAPRATRPAFVYVPTTAPAGVASDSAHGSAAIAQVAPGASGGPHIVSVTATPTVVHDGDTVHWDVRTSPDVVAVSARVATYGFDLQRSGPGHFTLGFAIPNGVPFFFHRTYTLDVVARDQAGETATSTIALAFQ